MKLIATIVALAAGTSALALPATPFNTPSPMLPGAYSNCQGFFLASPGVSCWSMAVEHGLSVDDFLRINPQVSAAGGCEGGGIVPHYWYCVKAWDGPGEHANFYRPSRRPQAQTPTETKNMAPTTTTTAKFTSSPKPTPTPEPDLHCEVDRCYRGFLRIVPGVEEIHSAFCSEHIEKSCTAAVMEELHAPAVISNECPQSQPCQAVSSACACYLAGMMGNGPSATALTRG